MLHHITRNHQHGHESPDSSAGGENDSRYDVQKDRRQSDAAESCPSVTCLTLLHRASNGQALQVVRHVR